MPETGLQKFLKFPPLFSLILAGMTIVCSIAGASAVNSYKVTDLYTRIEEVKKESATKESIDTLKEMVKGIDNKMDAKFDGLLMYMKKGK